MAWCSIKAQGQLYVLMKLVWLIEMRLNDTYSEVSRGKNLSDAFPIQNGLREGNGLSPLILNFALEYAVTKVQEN